MDSRVKQIWIDALEGGEYKQTKEALRKGDSYCCLGVLCDLYLKDTGEGRWAEDLDGDQFYTGKVFEDYTDEPWEEQETSELPKTVYRWAGLRDSCPDVSAPVMGYSTLIEMNDNGMDFRQIAEVIKAQL